MGSYSRYFCSFWVFAVKGLVALTILTNDSIPKRGEGLKVSCLTSPIEFKNDLAITWNYPSRSKTTYCLGDYTCPGSNNNNNYKFTANINGSYATIISLDRMKDNGTWTCTLSDNLRSDTTVISIYTSPKGVKYVQPILPDRDLGQESVTLVCETVNCAYPSPNMSWYYLATDQQKVLYNATDGVMVSNTTPCDQLEAIYTSTLLLTHGTTFQGNIPFKTKFVCAVQHPALIGDIIYSESSSYVNFAVNLTSVTLKDMNGGDLPSIVELIQGSVVTLKCMTSTSRPTATVKWYIGNTNITAGIENVAKPGENELEFMESKLTFTPSNYEHHNKSIYCLAFSSVNSSIIASAQHMLYVKVQVPNITLVYDKTSAAVGSTLSVVNGTSITLRCETGPSRPASIILWYKGDIAVQDGVTSRNESYSGLYKAISTFTFIASNIDHGMNLFCRGYNIDPGNAVTSTTIINVTVHVSSVTMNPADSSITFLEGDQTIIKCVTSPSRPRPQIRWWVGNETKTDNIKESISNSGNLIIMESEITLILNRSYRNRLLYCDTRVPEQETWISSFKSQINVWYPPSVPAVLAYNESFPWLENRTGIMECQVNDHGYPAASVTWVSARGKTDVYNHLLLENLTASDNGSSVKCILSNNFTVTKGLVVESMVRDLEVEYTPETEFVPSQTSVIVNETRNLLVTCNSRGHPKPSVEWLNRSQPSNILYMQNVSRHDSGTYICMAKSRSTNYGRIPLQSQKQLQLTVQFAPEMSVKVTPPVAELSSEVHIDCSAHGEPSDYKFYNWTHRLGNIELRHITGFQANQSLSVVRVPSITIVDMGTYICSAENGIAGPDGGIVQSMEAQIDVVGVPVTFVRDATFTGETNMSANIRIPFFSNPNITDLKYFKTWNNTPIANGTDTQVYHVEADISTVFYNTDVVLKGMEAVLNFTNLKESDFGQYTLVLYNNKGNTTLSVHLNASAPPSPVEQFCLYRFIGQYIEFSFVPGFSGGHDQTFTIQFKPSGSSDEAWKNTSINGLSEMDERYRFPNGTFLVQVEKLQPGRYVFRIFSVNKKNIRIYSKEVPVYIEAEPKRDPIIGLSVPGIAGGIGGGVGVILVIGVVIFLWRRHNHTNKAADDDIDRELQERERPESDLGLVDNPVYEKSSPRPGESSSKGTTGAMYATVVKTMNKAPMVEDPKNLYAQVEKTKKRKNKKGEIYENAYLPKKSPNQEDVYENSRQVAKDSSENLYEDSGATSANVPQVNKGGLLYADLKLDRPTFKNGKYVIHGLENRTEYAEIAYGRRGDPLPDSNDEEERNGATK